jgi:hypothetical protein
MSAILKGDILNVGQLENEIFNALNFYGCGFDYNGPTDQCEAQRQFANRLANAISNGVSRGVQQYLAQTVKTINQPTLIPDVGYIHTHPNIPQYDLTAP